MAFHTLAEFVATILITLITSGSILGGIFLYFRLRDKELEAEDSREVEARLRTLEARFGAMEGALVSALAQPPAPQTVDFPTCADQSGASTFPR